MTLNDSDTHSVVVRQAWREKQRYTLQVTP